MKVFDQVLDVSAFLDKSKRLAKGQLADGIVRKPSTALNHNDLQTQGTDDSLGPRGKVHFETSLRIFFVEHTCPLKNTFIDLTFEWFEIRQRELDDPPR